MAKIIIIAAVSENGVIGSKGSIPWHIPADLKRFKRLTTGYPVLMGRRTFESLNLKPLPGRVNVVLSATRQYEGVKNCATPQEALDFALSEEKVFVIGGSHLYSFFLPYAHRLEITHVRLTCNGDTFFPMEYLTGFSLIMETDLPADEKAGLPYRCTFSTYER